MATDWEGEDYRQGWPPGHFYSPIPSLREVRARADRIFEAGFAAPAGVNLNDAVQIETLERMAPYLEQAPFPSEKRPGLRFFYDNPNFGPGEASILQALMRLVRPRHLVEVGSGHSSCAVLDTNARFCDGDVRCTFIEPYPELLESLLEPEDRGNVTILANQVQDVDPEVFDALEPGDFLLIDSSHVSKVGSDVNHLFFSVLPALSPGVYVHVHDIYFPFEYPERWIFEGRAWNEAYLVRAFLQFNSAFEIVFFNSYFVRRYPELVKRHGALPEKTLGSSLWLRRS